MPVAEITLLINIGGAIGLFKTMLVVIFTAVLGAYLVRQQGLSTVFALQKEVNEGKVPALKMAEGVALLFAGAVLLTPGFITDAVGFALLIPSVRQAIVAWGFKRAVNAQAPSGYATPTQKPNSGQPKPTIIDGEFRADD